MIKNVTVDVDWPGQLSSNQYYTSDQWKELREALNKLYVGGPAIKLSYADNREAELALSSTFAYAKKQNAKSSGWNYQTTRRPVENGTDVYIRKIAHKE